MASQQPAVQTTQTQALVGNFSQTELDTIKATIAKGTSNEQFALFVQTCTATGLNPFLNQIYCIVYNGKDGPVMSIQIAVEGIVALAKDKPYYKGFIASEVKDNDEFEIDVVTGEPKHRITSMVRGKTVGAYCVAYRDGMPNVAVIVTNDQVDHLIKGRNGDMWKNYFDDMIVKHAIKRAFKRQFGIEVAEDELIGSGPENITTHEPQRRDITTEASHSDAPKTTTKQQDPPKRESNQDEAALFEQAKDSMRQKFTALGITEKADRDAYFKLHNVKWAGEGPTLKELQQVLKMMDMHIAEKQAADDAPLQMEE